MRRWLIVGAVVVVVGVGVVVAAMANLSRWVAANHDTLVARAEKELGRRVQFGEIGVSLWGGVGIRVADLRVADDPDYADGEFLRADSAHVTVRVLPALFGRWEVRRVTLRQPVVTLIRDANGLNVDSLGQRKRRKRDRPPSDAARPPEPRRLPLVIVGLLDLRDGELRWVDRRVQPPAELALHALHVEAEDLSVVRPVAFTVEARLLDAAERNLRAEGTIGPIGDPPDLEAAPIDATLSVRDVDADVVLRALPELAALVPPQLRLQGPVGVTGHAVGTTATFTLDGTADATAATVAWDDELAKPAAVPCTVTLTGRRDADALSFQRASVRLADATAAASGRVTPGAPFAVDLTVDATVPDLARLATMVPDLAGAAGALEAHVRVQGEVAAGRIPSVTGTLALRDVAARLPEAPVGVTGLTTTIQLEGDGASMPASRFQVDGHPVEARFAVRDLDAPHGELHVQGEAIPLTVVGTMPVKGLPPDVVRGVVVDAQGRSVDGAPQGQATIRSTSGTVHGADYANLVARLRVQGDVATMESFTLDAYDGTVRGSGRADVGDPERPRLAVDMSARGVGVEGLIASQKPKDMQRVSGRLDAEASLTATGRSWEALQRTVAGTGRIELRDGVVYDINIGDDVLGGVTIPGIANLLPERLRKKRPDLFSTGDTRFELLRASATIADETATTKDMLLSAKAFTVTGAGTLTVDGRVDFAGTFEAAKGLTADVTSTIREARLLANDRGLIEIPFLLRGQLPKVKAQPDLRFLTNLLPPALIEKGLDAVLGKDGKQRHSTEEKIKRGLDKLFR